MKAHRVLRAATAALLFFQLSPAFAKSAGSFRQDMKSLYEAACAGIGSGHAHERESCLRNGYDFIHDPNQPAPCSSWRQDEYALGMLQSVCTKNIDGKGWIGLREGCMNSARSEMHRLGLSVPDDLMDAQRKCGILHWHFTAYSQERCIENQLALAKQEENAMAMSEEDAFKRAAQDAYYANQYEQEGVLPASDRACFAPVDTDAKKINVRGIMAVFYVLGCEANPYRCGRAGIPH